MNTFLSKMKARSEMYYVVKSSACERSRTMEDPKRAQWPIVFGSKRRYFPIEHHLRPQKGAFIWVIEPISNAIATLSINSQTEEIKASEGQTTAIFGREVTGLRISDVLPFLDRDDKGMLEWNRVSWKARYCANVANAGDEGQNYIPCTVEVMKADIPDDGEAGVVDLRISYLPHIAGVLVVDAHTLTITSSNSAFSSTLF